MLGTKWQHSQSCFHEFQMSIYLLETGWEMWWQISLCLHSFYSIAKMFPWWSSPLIGEKKKKEKKRKKGEKKGKGGGGGGGKKEKRKKGKREEKRGKFKPSRRKNTEINLYKHLWQYLQWKISTRHTTDAHSNVQKEERKKVTNQLLHKTAVAFWLTVYRITILTLATIFL